MSSDESSSSGSEQEFSGDEGVTWEQARRFKLKFGKYSGRRLQEMIKTKKRRALLKYYIGWDKLRDDARENIRVALEHYSEMKKQVKSSVSVSLLREEKRARQRKSNQNSNMSLLKEEWISKGENRQSHALQWLENFRYHKPVVHAHVRDKKGGHHQVSIPRGQPGSCTCRQGKCSHIRAVIREWRLQ